MDRFQGVDYLSLASLLTEEEKLSQQAARAFTEREILPIVVECFRNARFPTEIISKLAESGFIGATLPQEYGCAAVSPVAAGLIYQELERGDSGICSFASVQSSFVMYPIYVFGSDQQKRRWLPRLAKGEAVGCFALTEADVGSDAASMKTQAVKEGDSYVLTGSKAWISYGSIADVAVVWAKVKQKGQADVIRGFLVEKETPGFQAHEIKNRFSFRTSIVSELAFDNCRVSESSLLPLSGGIKSPLMCISEGRYAVAWGSIGAAAACYHIALNYAKERTVFSKPIAQQQLVQKKLVDMLTEISKSQLLCLHLGRLKESGRLRPEQCSMAKMNNAAAALKIARMARDILGANGISDEYHVIRHLLNLEAVNTYEGTEDINRLIVGKDITALGAFE
jgi:glutaryl-CoA dehydrogenase